MPLHSAFVPRLPIRILFQEGEFVDAAVSPVICIPAAGVLQNEPNSRPALRRAPCPQAGLTGPSRAVRSPAPPVSGLLRFQQIGKTNPFSLLSSWNEARRAHLNQSSCADTNTH